MENCKLIIGQYNVTTLFSYPCGMVVYSIHGSNSREAHLLPRTCPFATHLSLNGTNYLDTQPCNIKTRPFSGNPRPAMLPRRT